MKSRRFLNNERLFDTVDVLFHYRKEFVLSRCLIVRNRRLYKMSGTVQLVLAAPSENVFRFDLNKMRIKIAVFGLICRHIAHQRVYDLLLFLTTAVFDDQIAHRLYPFGDIRIEKDMRIGLQSLFVVETERVESARLLESIVHAF